MHVFVQSQTPRKIANHSVAIHTALAVSRVLWDLCVDSVVTLGDGQSRVY